MATPVVTDKWAGNFDCDFCRRKRLMGSEFSKKVQALEKYRKSGGKLKCKQCVAKVEEEERKAAAARRGPTESDTELPPRTCAKCEKSLQFSEYNKNQWNKGEGKARCRSCVEKSLAEEAVEQNQSRSGKLEAARKEVEKAKESGDAKAILKAESYLSALEAEKVTGLKPIKMGRGRGRGRGAGRSGRGRR